MARSFRFLRMLGEGSFGAVHLVELREHEDFVQTLAVKWLHPRWSQSPEYAMRLRDEARLLALLRHQAIVRVHGLTRIDGRLAILMEPVDGADLGRVRSLPVRAALEVGAAVADALDAAWSEVPPGSDAPLEVVHRDIKPSNVMVTARGAVKVMDFGVARASFDTREAETRSQQFGTARYMAPERWLQGVAEAPSDVYSLGVTLLELISGEPVSQPRLSSDGYATDVGVAVGRLADHPDLAELIGGMLAFDPARRPTAAEVARRCARLAEAAPGEGLRDWASHAVSAAHNEGVESALTGTELVEESGAAVQTLPWTSEIPEAAVPPPRPAVSGWLRVAVGAATVALVGTIGVALAGRGGPVEVSVVSVAEPRAAVETPPPAPIEVAPEPVPEVPAPVPAPAPVAPVPRPSPRPAPSRPVEPVAAPVVAAVHPTGTVVFTIAEGWVVETGQGEVRRRGAAELPRGTATVAVVQGDLRRSCEIMVSEGRNEVRVDDSGRCSQ